MRVKRKTALFREDHEQVFESFCKEKALLTVIERSYNINVRKARESAWNLQFGTLKKQTKRKE
jgi:hypothetical protein